ncbi:hypothetical protein DSM03_1011136 [Leeuwenhoekiella aestuarii]|uniref:SpoIIAA-like protein n=1 Tax=Leeuwenhoekiella aestuarii TaxID=2249426 RepID=A0A4Q0NZP1_9FLAO|nr:hypothetical protein [Leeuwenhoekiella aestuarii]RXG18450.1 hypothetical protein DSM04_101647 [Leeuwenhoekiella aestuarii]RXG19755.1 hypothetical protein DSM03_1011136 [Leeuwenhoekiella aestuarii]
MVLKTIAYPFGEVKYYEGFIHVKFNEDLDEVKIEYSKKLFEDIEGFYGSEKYILISERNLKTSFNADLMKNLNLSKMRGLAVVSEEGVSRREELIKEQSLFKGSFAYFTNYKAAEEWARTFD